jgi:hypothetical protein
LAIVAIAIELRQGDDAPPRFAPPAALLGRDPLTFDGNRTAAYERAATFGLSHVLYTKSPGGVVVAAERTASFRPLIDVAVAGTDTSADTVEAIVLLESAGRPEAIAGSDPAHASGLTQIVAETGVNLLGMRVDLGASRRLTRQIGVAHSRGARMEEERLRAARRRIDARFDPREALAGTVRYLALARERFGRDDLAVVSYHMGIGNLEDVLHAYAGEHTRPIKEIVSERDLSWARVYFDSSPRRHAAAWRRLLRLGDDTETYYWRVLAAREIMRLFREEGGTLEELALLHGQGPSAEAVLHPPGSSERFEETDDLEAAWDNGLFRPLPEDPAKFQFRIDSRLGALAGRLERRPTIYRGLRTRALTLLTYLAREVNELSGAKMPLTVTRALSDDGYSRLLPGSLQLGTSHSSIHTTGYSFDVRRRYESGAQAAAFQYTLDRLQALGLIAWTRDEAAIHVTVAS